MRISDLKIEKLIESEAVPPLSMANAESKFTFDGVVYDTEQGLGSVPHNSNVLYRGFVGVLPTKDFRSLARMADRMETAKEIAELIKNGEPLGPPFLMFTINEDEDQNIESVEITGHEGRARTIALKLLGKDYVVVHFIGAMGIRSRDLDEEFFTHIKKHGIISEDGTLIDVHFEKILHDPNHR